MTTTPEYDVIIIGGGAAGLVSAVTLARARRRVLVVDAGAPRNAPAEHAHNYLGLEGVPPLELLQKGREEAASYGAELREGFAAKVSGSIDSFAVTLADGAEITARRLLITTGLTDELPDIPGLAERWGRDVLHCPFCHGWEVRNDTVGIIGSPFGVHQALMWRQWTDSVVLFAGDFEPTEEEYEKLAARDIGVVTDKIAGLAIPEDALTGVELVSGTTVPLQAVVTKPTFRANASILSDLGLDVTEAMMGEVPMGATFVATDEKGATSVAGVHAAGNVAAPMENLIGSAAAGVRVAGGIIADLIDADVKLAVQERARA
ncbi:MAG: NAD(P)/FAD-dependent oxidoreductase [Rhodococcus sp. (in: high G+C Gram-positive bacteria)]